MKILLSFIVAALLSGPVVCADIDSATITVKGNPSAKDAKLKHSGDKWELVVSTPDGERRISVPPEIIGRLIQLSQANDLFAIPFNQRVGTEGGYAAARFNGQLDVTLVTQPDGTLGLGTVTGSFESKSFGTAGNPAAEVTVLKAAITGRGPYRFQPNRESFLLYQDNVVKLRNGETVRVYVIGVKDGKARVALYGEVFAFQSKEVDFLRTVEVPLEYLARYPETTKAISHMSEAGMIEYGTRLYRAQGDAILSGALRLVYNLPRADLRPRPDPMSEPERLAAAAELSENATYYWPSEDGARLHPDFLTSLIWCQSALSGVNKN